MSSVHADPPPPIVTDPSGINYATGTALGKGGFAICHRAERYEGSRPTGQMVALKIVKTKMEPAKLAQKFVTELQIHSKLSHPNIVAFYRAFSFSTSTYVVLEICSNGSLADMLKRRKHLTLPEIRRYMIQICGAVKYLHHRHIVHRDLKTGNLFLDENMNVKVGDFGLAALLVTEKEMEVKRRTTMCGTPNYLAPEILEKGKGHDEKVDLWAIGVIAYTLAVGKAPFHASTKEEIYKKLKSGTYAWPELSATTNQSSDLRNLVSSLLVPEEHRPIPDRIVSQDFFKIAFVPPCIPATATEKAPVWSELSTPSADVVRRGYSDTWYAICKESGVGEYQEGKSFKLNGGRRVKSIVYDIAKEAQLGSQPTMPLPRHVVYTSTISNWGPLAAGAGEFSEHADSDSHGRLKELSHNEVANARPKTAEQRVARDAELMPPPSRTGRSGTVRKVARTISEETAKTTDLVRIASDEAIPNLQVAKVRPAAPATSRALRDGNHLSASGPSTARLQASLDGSLETAATGTGKWSADASLARRPKSTKTKERSNPAEAPGPLASLDELKRHSMDKRLRKKPSDHEVVEVLVDLEPPKFAQASAPSLPPPLQMARRLPIPSKTCLSAGGLPGTDPDSILKRLVVLRRNLRSSISNTSLSRHSAAEAEKLPFVTRWVDYIRKHGVGYVLSDGTVGCIINASRKKASPVTHVIVPDGQKWLAHIGEDYEHLDTLPLEILEDQGDVGIVRKVYKGLGSVKDGTFAVEADRRRTLSILWAKFGRYMCSSLDEADITVKRQDDNFVRFFQRIGSVGIWGFADGCLQAYFPDHTKIVLSATGTHASVTCISPEAATYLAAHGDLLPHHTASRQVFAESIQGLLHESGRVRARIMNANAISEKLEFILRVISQWVEYGGLGRVNEDNSCQGDNTVLRWSGMSVKDGPKKTDRVTIGRRGGDAEMNIQ